MARGKAERQLRPHRHRGIRVEQRRDLLARRQRDHDQQRRALIDRLRHPPGHRVLGQIRAQLLGPDHQLHLPRDALGPMRPQPPRGGLDHDCLTLAAKHGALDHVGMTDEPRHHARGGPLVDLLRRAALRDHALFHHHDAVRHHQRLALVMGDVDRGDADALLQVADEEAHVVAQRGVEIGERLVEEQHRRLDHQRAGQRDALLLPARQFPREAPLVARKPHHLEHLGDAGGALCGCDLAHLEPEGEVFRHRHVREERVGLEHHAEVAMLGGDIGHLPRAEQQPAAVDRLEARDAAQRRRLATARRPEQRDELALPDLEIDVFQNVQIAIELVDPVEGQGRHLDALCAWDRAPERRPVPVVPGSADLAVPAVGHRGGEIDIAVPVEADDLAHLRPVDRQPRGQRRVEHRVLVGRRGVERLRHIGLHVLVDEIVDIGVCLVLHRAGLDDVEALLEGKHALLRRDDRDRGALVLQHHDLGPVDRRDDHVAAHQPGRDLARPRRLGERHQFLDLLEGGVEIGVARAEELAGEPQEELRAGVADLVKTDALLELGVLPKVGPGGRRVLHHVGAIGEPDRRDDRAQTIVARVHQPVVQLRGIGQLGHVERLEEAFGAQHGGDVLVAHEDGIGRLIAAGTDLRDEILAKTDVELGRNAGGLGQARHQGLFPELGPGATVGRHHEGGVGEGPRAEGGSTRACSESRQELTSFEFHCCLPVRPVVAGRLVLLVNRFVPALKEAYTFRGTGQYFDI
ncbi:hypothetical protein SDC9_26421 [bioreactor metagenome]|uniref:Uncharacterized protein n=1 Tax=bioreactor metagenome TaxID=1076179 RepID=A0A644UNF3_9ZZZZ